MKYEGALWNGIVVCGAIGFLAMMGISKRFEFARESRRRGCVVNQEALEKAVAVWARQNKPIPAGADLFLELRTDGRIGRASPELEAIGLKAGSKALLDVAPDPWKFVCPTRVAHVRDRLGMSTYEEVDAKVGETHYRWSPSSASCLLYAAGQREEAGLEHVRPR